MGTKQETPDEGVVIGEEVGMRMKVGEWISSWLCREEGVRLPQANGGEKNVFHTFSKQLFCLRNSFLFADVDCQNDFKLVLAEPLEGRPDSHVQKFLNDHGGPGLQHIGLVSRGPIEGTVEKMLQKGAEFRTPPPTYYKLVSRKKR